MRGWPARWLAVSRAIPWRDLLANCVLAAGALLLMRAALSDGLVRWAEDTKFFYYPLLSTVSQALKEGRLPLWEPGLFGGYPLFADGEAGMLYPPNLIALRLLEPADALVVLRVLRFYLAGAFTYAYLRAIGCARLGATVAGLVFALSGFMVGQVVHENLDSGMVWLPLALAFAEYAVRTTSPRRYLLAAFAGVALAMQWLAVHVQVCVFSTLLLFPYIGWRVLSRDSIRASLPGRLLIGLGLALCTGLVALGLAAVQVLPLLDLAERSARGHGIGISAATINSVTPFRLLTLVFPDLLRGADGHPQGYWVDWEVAVYVGVPALAFALCAALVRLDRYTWFFGACGAISLALAMGRYGPPWVVTVTRDLLGDHGLRSPGRFAFLWTYCVAVLAGLGVDYLARGQPPGARRRLWLAAVLTLLAGLSAGLLLAARVGRDWLLAQPDAARAWITARFIAFDRTADLATTAAGAYQTLLAALDPQRPLTTIWVLSVVASYALLVAWYLGGGRSAAGAARGVLHGALGALTIVVVALPLLAYGTRAHRTAPMRLIEPDSGGVAYLRGELAPGQSGTAERPLYRVYTSQPAYLHEFDVEPNALLPHGVHEAGGYSSLNTEVNLAYAWAAETSMGRMLDVWNARYFVWPNVPVLLPSHELTSYHPQRPLASGSGMVGRVAGFRVPSVEGENVRVIATLRDAWEAPAGAVVAWVSATDDQGQEHRWPLRAGIELQEAAAPPATEVGTRVAGAPFAVATWDEWGPDGALRPVYLYYASLPLPGQRTIVRLAITPAALPAASHTIVRTYGLGVGMPSWHVHNVTWFDRERFTLAYRGEETLVYRNETALPRAYLVPRAAPLPRGAHIKELSERGVDPSQTVLVDAPSDEPLEGPWVAYGAGSEVSPDSRGVEGAVVADSLGRTAVSPAGTSTIATYESDRVVVETQAPAGAWLFLSDTHSPAWRVYVDDVERPLRLANALFRAVAVPAGAHVVEFRYEPEPLRLGAAISLATGVVVLIAAALSGATAIRRRP